LTNLKGPKIVLFIAGFFVIAWDFYNEINYQRGSKRKFFIVEISLLKGSFYSEVSLYTHLFPLITYPVFVESTKTRALSLSLSLSSSVVR